MIFVASSDFEVYVADVNLRPGRSLQIQKGDICFVISKKVMQYNRRKAYATTGLRLEVIHPVHGFLVFNIFSDEVPTFIGYETDDLLAK